MKSLELSKDLRNLLVELPGEDLSVGKLIETLGDRSFGLALIVFALPSALPVPAPGYSIPLGVILILVAGQMIFGRKRLWLPQKILAWKFRSERAQKFLSAFIRFLQYFEKILSPRMEWVCAGVGIRIFGLLVVGMATLMLIPIPFTNTLPAMMVLCIGLGLTEDDGIFGLGVGVVSILVLIFYAVVFSMGIQLGWDYFFPTSGVPSEALQMIPAVLLG
jgi:hypothetical protein